MKKQLLLYSTFILLLVLPSITEANLLTNDNFNIPASTDTPTDWSPWGWGSGWANHENKSAVTNDGSYYLVVGAGGDGGGGFFQIVEAVPGKEYTLTVLSGADAWYLPTGMMSLIWLDESGNTINSTTRNTVDPAVYGDNYDIAHPWQSYTLSGTAPEGTAQVKVEFSCNPGTGSVWFEDAVLMLNNNPDFDNSLHVDVKDFSILSSCWLQSDSRYDLTSDGVVSVDDLKVFAADWLAWTDPGDALTIEIDPSTTYQKIEGVGASLTDSSAWLIYEFLNASERQAVLTDLFDKENGIGIGYLRQPMGSSDFRLAEYSYDDLPDGVSTDYTLEYFSIAYDEDYIVPTLQEILAVNPDVKIMGSPWSPPVWMKESNHIGGGSLKSNVYTTYANYFVKFVQAYAAHGIDIDAITLQNEPYFEPWSYAGCHMEPAEQIKLVKKMGPAFENNSITTKILVWDHNWDNTNFPLDVLADSQAFGYIDGVAWHHYSGDPSAQSTVHDAYPTKSVHVTEASDGTWNDGGFENDLIRNATTMIEVFRNWGQSYIKWNLALDENNGPKIAGGCDTCYGVVTINQSTRQVTKRPHYYVFGHVGKFIEPGAVRIDSTDGDVSTFAFKNTDGSVVLFAVNTTNYESNLKLSWNSQWALRKIPARALMTFRWNNQTDAKVDVYLTTSDKASLLKKQDSILFHN